MAVWQTVILFKTIVPEYILFKFAQIVLSGDMRTIDVKFDFTISTRA